MTDPIYADLPEEIRRLLAGEPPEITDEDLVLVQAALAQAKLTADMPVKVWARELAKSMCEDGCAYDRQFVHGNPSR